MDPKDSAGDVANGGAESNSAPINPETGQPYFAIREEGWGTGWKAGPWYYLILRRDQEIVTRGDRERRASNRVLRIWRFIVWAFIAVTATIALVTQDANADKLRCGNALVQPGDSYLDVTDACGEPAREVAVVDEDNDRIGTALYYRGDHGQNDRKVHMRGGTVIAIQRLD